MFDNTTRHKAFNKGLKPPLPLLLTRSNSSQMPKAISLGSSPLHKREPQQSPFIGTLEEIQLEGEVHRLKLSPSPILKPSSRTSMTPQTNLDLQTLKAIDKLVEDRQKSVKGRRKRIKDLEVPERANQSANQARNNKFVERVRNLLEIKGLAGNKKTKIFDSKFAIFEGVKTFIDARRIFKDVTQTISKTPIPKTARATISEPTGTSLQNVHNESGEARIKTLKTLQDGPEASFELNKRKSHGNLVLDEKKDSSLGLVRKVSSLINSPSNKRNALTQEEFKALEIRKLYLKLKDETIEKFGKEIFDKAQDKLKDPKCLEKLERKRRKEIAVMRKLGKDLGNFELNNVIVNHLRRKEQTIPNLLAETSNRFDNFIDRELIENEGLLFFGKIPTTETSQDEEKMFKNNGAQPLRKQDQEDDPQIRMFQKIKLYRQKTKGIVKVLRNKIEEVHKKKDTPLVSKSHSQEDIDANNKSLNNSPNVSPSVRPVKGSFTFRELDRMPSIAFINGKLSPGLERKTPVKSGNQQSSMGSIKSILKKKASAPLIETVSMKEEEKDKKGARTPGQYDDFLTLSPIERKRTIPRLNSLIFKQIETSARNGLNSPMSPTMPNSQKEIFIDLCTKLDNLTTSNRDLNVELKKSLKQLQEPYRTHTKTLKNLDMPESLQKASSAGYIKSTSKLAVSLAQESLKASRKKII